MSGPTDSVSELDEILAQFFRELECASQTDEVLRDFCRRYPQHADEFRGVLEIRPALLAGDEREPEKLPQRLGDFRIVRRIDSGGMGDIYEAIQEPLKRRVVVKTIRREVVSPNTRERFLREQQVLAKLHDSHIVPVFAAGEDNEVQYFAMPFIEGATLKSLVHTAAHWTTVRAGSSRTPPLSELAKLVVERTISAKKAEAHAETESIHGREAKPREQAGEAGSPPVAGNDNAPAGFPFSPEYFRSVAEVMADVGESLEHAHHRGFLHRDVKPSNIMVDVTGQSWVIDFGLARSSQDVSERPTAPNAGLRQLWETITQGRVGTPGYMAPEQERDGKTDARSDVWGLGVTLYELLTLRRAFPTRSVSPGTGGEKPYPPVVPHKLVKNVPRDLDAICAKSIRWEPEHRYRTAGEFADDLRRWLRGEPTMARPARAPRRVVLWARRNKAWAAAIAVAVLFVLVTATGLVAFAEQRAKSERREREIAEGTTQVLEVQAAISEAHRNGWAKNALDQMGNIWKNVNRIGNVRANGQLRSLAASVLTGLDVRRRQSFEDFSGQYLIFDPSGQRLLIGAVADKGRHPLPARIWNRETATLDNLPAGADGPVGFRSSGTPVQLQLDAAKSQWVLLDLASGKGLVRGDVPSGAKLDARIDSAMTADGARIAVGGKTADGKMAVWIWDGAGGELLHSIVAEVDVLAFTRDGAWLAGGGEDGTVRVWSVSTGKESCTLKASKSPITCLAFAVNRTVRDEAAPRVSLDSWLLAVGDADGGAALWDLLDRVPRAFCRGSQNQLFSLAFSPDGMLLASAGRAETRLWDVATGRLLLTIPGGDYITGLAFSPDGRTLATSAHPLVIAPYLTLWDLDFGGAGRKYLGLGGQVGRVAFSADGRRLAGLAHNWRIAVWDVRKETLERVFVAPRGIFTDNAAIAFSRDGRQLAFSAMKEARLWDVASGRQLGKWRLPGGLVDLLAFDARGRLISLRSETRDGKLPPLSNAHPAQHPRVCRIRELVAGAAPKTLAEITAFNWHVHYTAIAPDASYVVIDGLGGPGGQQRMLKVFDPRGKELADIRHDYPEAQIGALNIDPTGRHLAAMTDRDLRATLLAMPSGKFQGRLAFLAAAQSPQTRYWVRKGDETPVGDRGMWLFERDAMESRIGLGMDVPVTSMQSEFDSSGRYFAWGSEDGSVTVCDLKRMWEQLAQIDSK